MKKQKFVHLFLSAAVLVPTLLWSFAAMADTPSLDNLSTAELEDAILDFSSVMSHVSVSPASSLGNVFGFEVGLIAGIVDTPGLDSISKSVDPNSVMKSLPHATLFGAVSFPLGLTGELNFIPKTESQDVTFKNTSVGVKWTFSQLFSAPVDMAVRVSTTKSDMSFVQNDPVPNTKVSYDGKTTEAIFLVSKNFLLVEPFVGMGAVSSDGEISATSDIFTDVTGNSASKKQSGTHYLIGANFNLLFVKLGLEAGKIFDSQKVSAKVSFYF